MSFPATTLSADELQQAARPPLAALHADVRLHGRRDPRHRPGEGCYLEDANGKRYLDALAGLFAVNIGYGFGEEMGEAAAAQMRELPFYTNWSYAHPRAIELAAEVAELAPGDLNRSSSAPAARRQSSRPGSSLVSTTRRAASALEGRCARIAYHGTTMGALSINGIAALKTPFEPLVPDAIHVRNTNRAHRPPDETEAEFTASSSRTWRRRSSRRGRTRSPWSSWSRFRTPAPSTPPEGTGRASERSATATGSFSPPTR